MEVLIVGGGNMGKTYAQSFSNSNILSKKQIHILEKDQLKIDLLKRFSVGETYKEAGDFIKKIPLIVLAVKPQDTKALFNELKPFISPQHIVISIMAGVTIATLKESLGVEKVVRAMPNLPAQIGVGMTVFTASGALNKKEIASIKKLLDSTGVAVEVEEEGMINAATAISGSGPAYVFYIMDAMIQKAVEMGFDSSTASKMVEQTFLGATHLYKRGNLSCEQWIKNVSSRGGTTEAAINSFDKSNLKDSISKGLEAALNRAEELSKE